MSTVITAFHRERVWAYVLLRGLTGLDYFGHGFARIFTGTHLSGFAHGMVHTMAATPLPSPLTLAMGYVIPCVELVVGTLLLLGAGVRIGLFTAFLQMFVLMFGISLLQEWNIAGLQLQYGLVLAILLFGRSEYDASWIALVRPAAAESRAAQRG
jgi:thiosulfate dehydrogenase (quinone) large subunit